MLHWFTQYILHCLHFTHNTVSKRAICRPYWCERGGGVNIVFVYFGKPFMKVSVLQLRSETVALHRRRNMVFTWLWWPNYTRGRMWPKFPEIHFTVEENPSTKKLSRPGSKPNLLDERQRLYPSTTAAVNNTIVLCTHTLVHPVLSSQHYQLNYQGSRFRYWQYQSNWRRAVLGRLDKKIIRGIKISKNLDRLKQLLPDDNAGGLVVRVLSLTLISVFLSGFRYFYYVGTHLSSWSWGPLFPEKLLEQAYSRESHPGPLDW